MALTSLPEHDHKVGESRDFLVRHFNDTCVSEMGLVIFMMQLETSSLSPKR